MNKDIDKINDNSGSKQDSKDKEDECFFITTVVENFIHNILDIEYCASTYIPLAHSDYVDEDIKLKSDLNDLKQPNQEQEDLKKIQQIKRIRSFMRSVKKHANSSPATLLEKSLFISLFAAFDKYIGEVFSEIYKMNSNLYNGLNREITLSEALSFTSMDELKESVLEKDIETLRRKSYIDQFKELESRFSITLTKFDDWKLFVEASQRRNLYTHCDGIISKQYLDVCRNINYSHDSKISLGDKLELGADYFSQSCLVVTQVGIMLGQTLWRKTSPSDIEHADKNLSNIIFNYLEMEKWEHAIKLSIFALSLPKISSELFERIFLVNYAIALKAIGDLAAAKNILDRKDWSATSYDFKMAYSIINDEFEEAKNLMLRIGKFGDLIFEISYHDWPLFRDFRNTPEFLEGYREVYGYDYLTKLESILQDDEELATDANTN